MVWKCSYLLGKRGKVVALFVLVVVVVVVQSSEHIS